MFCFVFATFATKCKVICEQDTKSHARHITFSVPPIHSHSYTKDSHSTRITLLFLNSVWVLLRPTELSTIIVRQDLLSEKTRKSNHLQMKLQRQHFLLSYLKTLSVGPGGVLNSRPPASQPDAQPSEPPVRSASIVF